MKPIYSIIIPMFNEEEVIELTYKQLTMTLSQLKEPYELVFVNDGSRDQTAHIVKQLALTDSHVKLVNFSRNFGHQIAITAGIEHAEGKALIIIDADLQDPPSVMLQMIEKWKEGYEVVYGKRVARKGETWFKKFSAKWFYRILRLLTNVDIPSDTGDFRLIDRKVADVLSGLKEKNRFVRGLVSWVGFKQISVEFMRDERAAGQTKYPLRRMIKFALDGITSFSYKPLRIASYIGFTLSFFSFIYLLVILYQHFFTDRTIPGWTSLIGINLLFNGIILILLGIIGEYIGRIYDESKNRPLYIVSEVVTQSSIEGSSEHDMAHK